MQRSLKLTIHVWSKYRNLNLKTGTVEGEADMETVSCAFSLLCLILYMSGWSDVENEQRSGCGEWSGCGEYLMRIFICVWQKNFLFCIDIM